MSGSCYGQNAYSVYLEKPRPTYLHRQRSNSLPPNSFLAHATEVSMMFSAAERATARRKKMYSVDYSSTPGTPFDRFLEQNVFPQPPSHVISKPSPLRQDAVVRQSIDKPLPPDPLVTPIMKGHEYLPISKRPIPPTIDLPESLLQQLPVSPLSPKRQVVSPSLKSYADSLLQFTHSRLISTIPAVHVTSPRHQQRTSEPVSLQSPRLSRPVFQSKFSDWSTVDNSPLHDPQTPISRRDSIGLPGLLSPDSFFGVDQPAVDCTDNRISGFSFASSETYEQHDVQLPPTPPQEDQEISYFTNFDKFLDAETWPTPQAGDESDLDSIIIDLSPLGKAPLTPSDQVMKSISDMTKHKRRSTATTIIRHPSASAPLLGSGMAPCSITPVTPIHIAEVAIKVPGSWVGAIG